MNTGCRVSAEQQATVSTAEVQLAAVNADPKWVRRWRVIEALEEYKARLNARSSLHDRYETLRTRLYSGRSSRITGMPTNHDQFAAGDRFAEMLDEKMELERALAEDDSDEVEMAAILAVLDKRDQAVIEEFYLGDQPRKAIETLCALYGLSSTHVYRIRDAALDALYDALGFQINDENAKPYVQIQGEDA